MWKRALFVILLGVMVGAGSAFLFFRWQQGLKPVPVKVSSDVLALVQKPATTSVTPAPAVPKDTGAETEPTSPTPSDTVTMPTTIDIPSTFTIEHVPFISQAPTKNWDLPFQEACEEASVFMVSRFYNKRPLPDVDEQAKIITDMTVWGEEHFDGQLDTNAKTTARYFTEYLEMDPKRVNVLSDITIDDIKAVIASGKPVIVPAAGRDLGNEHFRDPGPLYHMLVIIGYTQDEFITNDPGTRFGEGFRYKQQVLFDAIHDLTPDKEQIRNGKKVMIVVGP